METQLPYALFENKLTSDPNDYLAQTQSIGTITETELIEEMTSHGSTLTKAEALSFLEEYFLALKKSLLAGYSINTELFNISTSILGVFEGVTDTFDKTRHSVRINVNLGTKLRSIENEFKPVKNEAVKPLPSLINFKDVASSNTNQTLTSIGVGHITGNRLNFDEADQTQGVFFVATNGIATRVTTMVRHKPTELIFMIPSLSSGNYYLEVRAAAKNSKEIRIGRLLNDLVVN